MDPTLDFTIVSFFMLSFTSEELSFEKAVRMSCLGQLFKDELSAQVDKLYKLWDLFLFYLPGEAGVIFYSTSDEMGNVCYEKEAKTFLIGLICP